MINPQRGLVTTSAYLHGIGDDLNYIGRKGVIEHVGEDYFVLRVDNSDVILVKESEYNLIEDEDFN